MKSEQLAQLIATIASDKKAEQILALDLRGISSFTDFFVICSGTSEPHLKAILSGVQDRLFKEHQVRAHAVEGDAASHWVVADFSDVVVHVFHDETRLVYSLEQLWSDAPRLKLEL